MLYCGMSYSRTFCFFFFSSRRRHTRSDRDWSSDVCSSDLRALGIHAESVDGQDVQAVFATMRRLVERARRGEGPAFLECKTYRYYGHHVGDVNREYRSRDEEREWMTTHDPLQTLAARLKGLVDEGTFERILADVKVEI